MKQVTPKGLLLANPGKQAPVQDPKSIECGKCHVVIYTANERFDPKAFQDAKRIHYSISPTCEAESTGTPQPASKT
jgi:hypothetical protein